MCEQCSLIDYPVAEIWRPCWQPRRKRPAATSDSSVTPADLAALRAAIRRLDRQVQVLRRLCAPHLRPVAFEGLVEPSTAEPDGGAP